MTSFILYCFNLSTIWSLYRLYFCRLPGLMLRAALFLSFIQLFRRFSFWSSFKIKYNVEFLFFHATEWRQSQLRLKIRINFSLCAAIPQINKKSRAETSWFELPPFSFISGDWKELHYQQRFQLADVSYLLFVAVQRLASVCMSLSSYDPLLWETTRRFSCLSSCWSLRLGFSVSTRKLN